MSCKWSWKFEKFKIHNCVKEPIIFFYVSSTRLAAGGCIGRRFFQASSQAALLRDLRQRIQEVSDFHHAASQALRVPPPPHTLTRQPGRRKPWQSSPPLPHFSSSSHRAGQVGHWCLMCALKYTLPVVWLPVVCYQASKSPMICCLQVVWCVYHVVGWWKSTEAGSISSLSSSRVWTTQTGTGHAAASGGFVFVCL